MIPSGVVLLLIFPSLSQVDEISFNDIEFTTPQKGFCVGDSGAVFTTADSGYTWTRRNLSIAGNCEEVAFSDSLHGWILVTQRDSTAVSNSLLRTTDGGATWSRVELDTMPCDCRNLNGAYIVRDLYPFGSDTLFLVTNILLKTYDAGRTWVRSNSFPAGHSILFTSARRGFAYMGEWFDWGLGRGSSYVTEDGGDTWTLISNQFLARVLSAPKDGTSMWMLDIDLEFGTKGVMVFRVLADTCVLIARARLSEGRISEAGGSDIFALNERTGWAVGGGVWRTDDGGSNWKLIYTFRPDQTPKKARFTSPRRGFVVGPARTFLHTSDGGHSWTDVDFK